jgi:hypothetical protein
MTRDNNIINLQPNDYDDNLITNNNNINDHDHHKKKKNRKSKNNKINYRLLQLTKQQQQQYLRYHIKNGNLLRIQDYYESIQNYYYHIQELQEISNLVYIKSPKPPTTSNDDIIIYIDYEYSNDDNDDGMANDELLEIQNRINQSNATMEYIDQFANYRITTTTSPTTRTRIIPPIPIPTRNTTTTTTTTATTPSTGTTNNTTTNTTTSNNITSDRNRMTNTNPNPTPDPYIHTNDYLSFSNHPNDSITMYTMLDIDDSISSSQSWTVLYNACYYDQYYIVQYLIQNCYANVHCIDRYKNNLLHWLCHSHENHHHNHTNTKNNTTNNYNKTTSSIVQFVKKRIFNNKQNPNTMMNHNNTTTTTTTTTSTTTISNTTGTVSHITTSTSSSTTNIIRIQLLQYIMECAPQLIYQCNIFKELPIHWICQYSIHDDLIQLQTMIQFIIQHTKQQYQHQPSNIQQEKIQEKIHFVLQYHDDENRTPIDVAKIYNHPNIVHYLQSLLI